MRGPFILSIGLHVAVVLLAWIGLPSFAPDRVIEPQQVIDVAVVTDIATKIPPTPPKPVVKAKPEPKPKPKPKKARPPKPQASLPKPPAPPPPPPDAVALPEKPKPKKPEPKKPEVKPKPEPKPVVKPEPKPEPKPVVKPKPEPKPKPKEPPKKVAKPDVKLPPKPRRKPKPPPEDDFASVLKTVEKLKKQPKAKKPEKSFDESIADALKKHDSSKPQSQQVSRLDQRLSMSEVDALKRQIEGCWNPPAGAPEAENLVVEVRLVINRDRTVQSAQIVDTSRMFREPFYRAAAESVIRAIKNPRCTPLELPQGKYDLWKETRLTFDPRELVGR
jgi:hypothetical protein